MRVVIPELSKRYPETPSPGTRLREAKQERFHTLVDPLGLAIRLRMVGRVEFELRACCLEHFLPKMTSEYRIPIGHNRSWEAMDLVNLLDE